MNRLTLMMAVVVIACTSCSSAQLRASSSANGTSGSRVRLIERMHFPAGSDRVLASEVGGLKQNALWMEQNPGAVLMLEGHCDERGTDSFNMELGDRRARSVAAALAAKGADASRFVIVSQGERAPLDARHTPAAWSGNRRVEFVVR